MEEKTTMNSLKYLDEFRGVAATLCSVNDDVVIARQTIRIVAAVMRRFDQRGRGWHQRSTGRGLESADAADAGGGRSLNVGTRPADGRRGRYWRQRTWAIQREYMIVVV